MCRIVSFSDFGKKKKTVVWNCWEMLSVFPFENLEGRRLWSPKGLWGGNVMLVGGSAVSVQGNPQWTLRTVDVFLEASSL